MKAAFYKTKIDGLQMIVSVNLDHQKQIPIVGMGNCLELAVAVKPATPRSQRDKLLHDAQFALIDALTSRVDMAYAGRTSRPLQRNLYFYCSEDQLEAAADAASHVLAGFETDPVSMTLSHFVDDAWTVYSDILLPGETDAVEIATSEAVIL